MKKNVSILLMFIFFKCNLIFAQFKLEVKSYSITRLTDGQIINGKIIFNLNCLNDTSLNIVFPSSESIKNFKNLNQLPETKFKEYFKIEMVTKGNDTISGPFDISPKYVNVKAKRIHLKKGKNYAFDSTFSLFFMIEIQNLDLKEFIIHYQEYVNLSSSSKRKLNNTIKVIVK